MIAGLDHGATRRGSRPKRCAQIDRIAVPNKGEPDPAPVQRTRRSDGIWRALLGDPNNQNPIEPIAARASSHCETLRWIRRVGSGRSVAESRPRLSPRIGLTVLLSCGWRGSARERRCGQPAQGYRWAWEGGVVRMVTRGRLRAAVLLALAGLALSVVSSTVPGVAAAGTGPLGATACPAPVSFGSLPLFARVKKADDVILRGCCEAAGHRPDRPG